MRKHPGEDKYVPEIQLLLAAAHAMAGRRAAATAALKKVRTGRPDWSAERELARNPFHRDADRKHWVEAMEKAGFA
jgi:hypothetical protein